MLEVVVLPLRARHSAEVVQRARTAVIERALPIELSLPIAL
jgi:hypothetical protein